MRVCPNPRLMPALMVMFITAMCAGQTTSTAPASYRERTDQRQEDLRAWQRELNLTGGAGGMDYYTQAEMGTYLGFLA